MWTSVHFKVSMVVCPNFGHPVLTSSYKKYNVFADKKGFATLVNGLSVSKLFQLSNDDLLFSKHAHSIYKVCKRRMTKLGQGVEVRENYPIVKNQMFGRALSLNIGQKVFI